jgi:SAM-dependent methyltransferase
MASSKPPQSCPICGGEVFVAGPKGRAAPNGSPPRCAGCGSLERHRAFRVVLSALAPLFSGGRALQFSEDLALPREAFGTVEVSVYGGANSLDMAAIDRPDGSYDLVVANHVLEHVADDRAALAELARVGRAVFLSVPDLLRVERTVEYGRPRADKHGHYRLYGPDIEARWREAVPDWAGIGVVAADPVTGAPDRATLLSRSGALLAAAAGRLEAAGLRPFAAL